MVVLPCFFYPVVYDGDYLGPVWAPAAIEGPTTAPRSMDRATLPDAPHGGQGLAYLFGRLSFCSQPSSTSTTRY